MAQRKDLGKGIRALIANVNAEPKQKLEPQQNTSNNISSIEIDQIEANPYQPRRSFDEEELEDLVSSISQHGIIQPITVKRISAKQFHIISGERRFRAAKLAGLNEIPVFIREAGDQEMLELALIENIQRSDLNPIDIAISYQRLIDEFDITHESISQRVGKNRSTVTNYIRLLKLVPSAQQAIRDQQITMGHAKVLAGIDNADRQLYLLKEIMENGLSVREAEFLGSQKGKTKKQKSSLKQGSHSPEMNQIIDRLSEKFGTKVKVSRKNSGQGKLEVAFKSDKELNQILDNILD